MYNVIYVMRNMLRKGALTSIGSDRTGRDRGNEPFIQKVENFEVYQQSANVWINAANQKLGQGPLKALSTAQPISQLIT